MPRIDYGAPLADLRVVLAGGLLRQDRVRLTQPDQRLADEAAPFRIGAE